MELMLAVACEDARVRPDGKLDVIGIFNELSAPGFPAAQDRMTVVLVMEWPPETEGKLPIRADLLDEAGRQVLTIQGHTEVSARAPGRPPSQTRLVMPLEQVVFPEPGRYDFELRAGDTTRRALSLFVRKVEEGADPTADERV
jgi:hypothetical protein